MPGNSEAGDMANNAAMVLPKRFHHNRTDLTDKSMTGMDNRDGYVEKMEKAGTGFINFTLSLKWWAKALEDLLAAGENYGQGSPKGLKAMVEYVSANPTGPLHVGHGRGAAIGDALSRVMARAGYEVSPEYYITTPGVKCGFWENRSFCV